MRRVREILRLKYEAGASDRAIARSVGVARSTARLCLDRVAAAGLTWPLPEGLTDGALEALLFAGAGAMAGQRRKAEPDWAEVHRELRRPGVTLMLLWEEYRAANPGGYQYSRWCELYRAWEGRLSPTMRQVHPAGERLFVDFAGQTVEVTDPGTGEVRAAQVFVAVLGASNYTYGDMLPAAVGQDEVVEPMGQGLAGDGDGEFRRIGEVGQRHPAGLGHLAEDDVALRTVQGAPVAHPPLQGPPHAVVREGVRVGHLQVAQQGVGLHRRVVLQDRQQQRLPDRGQRVGDGAAALGQALGWQAGIGLDPAGGGLTEAPPVSEELSRG
jgi:hypothetical protein